MKPLIYIASPYTIGDPVLNVRTSVFAAEEVVRARATPVVPLLSMLWHMISPHDPDFWYALDLELLARCDGLLRLPGKSWGADLEVAEADRLGIPIVLAPESGHGNLADCIQRLLARVNASE